MAEVSRSNIVAAASRWPRPSAPILALAVIGAVLLIVVGVTAWPVFGDEQAYWRAAERLVAGEPLYDPNVAPNRPYAFWYPPVIAQALAPFTLLVSPATFTVAWTVLLMVCLWLIAGRNVFLTLALVAFLPVALELRVRNVHIVVALLTVLALRRSWVFWIPAIALKLAPVVGPIYLLAAGRRREAVLVAAAGITMLVVSVVLSPGAWLDFVAVATSRTVSDAGGVSGIPYVARLLAALLLAVVAGRRGGRAGEVGVVFAILIANPTLWPNAFSLLLAIVPLVRSPLRSPGMHRVAGGGGDAGTTTA